MLSVWLVGPLVAIYLISKDKRNNKDKVKLYRQVKNLSFVMFFMWHNVVKIIVQESINPGWKYFLTKLGFSWVARNVVIYANAHSYNQFIRDYIYLNDFIALSCHTIFP